MAEAALGGHPGTWMGLLWALLTLLNHVGAFNLDTTHTLHKQGDRGTFFGFSLALHQQLTPEPHSWILVGAPQAPGRGLLRGSRPGALFKCPITPEEYDCVRVDIDGEVSLNRESKDNQWLGVTVKSQGIGGKVVTCAHLYELRQRVHQPSETRDPIGRCYVLSEDLTERDDLDGGEWKFCEGRPQGHEQFGFCQQGLSVSFTPDNNFILFGAPGTYNWKGEMRVQLLNQTLLDLGFFDDGPYEVADQKQLNARLIPVPYHSYLGRSRPPCSLLERKRGSGGGWQPGLRLYPHHTPLSDMATGRNSSRDSSYSWKVIYDQKPSRFSTHSWLGFGIRSFFWTRNYIWSQMIR